MLSLRITFSDLTDATLARIPFLSDGPKQNAGTKRCSGAKLFLGTHKFFRRQFFFPTPRTLPAQENRGALTLGGLYASERAECWLYVAFYFS